MKTLCGLTIMFAMTSLAAPPTQVYPASTNASAIQTLFGVDTFAQPVTMLSLTADTVLKSSGFKAVASIPNGSGVLTDDGAGNFTWTPLSGLGGDVFTHSNNVFLGSSNVFDGDVFINGNLYVNSTNPTTTVSNLVVTGVQSNLNLTASTILKADANKAIVSVANGTGALTDNGSGTFSWVAYATGADILTYSNNSTAFVGTTVNTLSNNIISQVATNRYVPGTNACAAPDFSKDYGWTNVTSGFTTPLPINLPVSGTNVPTFVWYVQGNGTPVQITAAVNEHVVPGSVMWVTNLTALTFHLYGNQFTNVYGVPIY